MTNPTAYVTTPIYYPSGDPHLGSAYTGVAADTYARFKRLDGFDTKFLTGTDEHGLKIQRTAEKNGMEPLAYLDGMTEKFKALTPMMNLSNDDFIRTTEERHKRTAIAMWNRLNEKGYIYKSTYAGWYSVSDETFYTEDELMDGRSPDSGHPVEWVEEESYYFKLSAFGEKLLAWYDGTPEAIQPKSRRNEVRSFVKGGLRDLSISRSTFSWGVPVPGDKDHIMYVWIDALTNYLSTLGWPDGGNMKYWPAVHVVGKDILKFHAVYWPAMLMAAEVDLPKKIYAHGWWTVEGEKMSKSKGNVVDPQDLVNTFGCDAVRYFMLREVPFGNDGDFSRGRLINRINSELANALGNLFQRVLSMVAKNCEGKIPDFCDLRPEDTAFFDAIENHKDKSVVEDVRAHMENLAFHKALDSIWEVVTLCNQFMDKQEPWALKKADPARMAHVLRVLMEGMVYPAILLQPFIPQASTTFMAQLGLPEGADLSIFKSAGPILKTGAPLPQPHGVFPRFEEKEAAA